jgi:hypothetical protein
MSAVHVKESEMNMSQLTGWHNRLKLELSIAYASRPWQGGHIDRIAAELAIAEQEICRLSSSRNLTLPVRRLRNCVQSDALEESERNGLGRPYASR